MPRPCKPRRIGHCPGVVHFKPQGVPLRMLEEVTLAHDEVEAIRLADLEDLSHEEVGQQMEVSRATAGRILASARKKVAHALTQGLAIRIETVSELEDPASPEARSETMPGMNGRGPRCEGPRTGRGLGRCHNQDTQETPVAGEERSTDGPDWGRGPGNRPRDGRGPGRGVGGGRGKGRGRGRGNR